MIKYLYTLSIYLYKYAITFLSIFNKKAKLKMKGIQLSKSIVQDFGNNKESELIFIHCASQGEHEQVKPIIRWILKTTELHIVLSFYSPSGFMNAKNDASNRITKIYLPFDTPNEISNLVTHLKPKFVIIVKNEWWWNLIYELKKQSIPTYLVSATFRNNHYFIRRPYKFFINGLDSFKIIFVVDTESKSIISRKSKTEIIESGDTRIDQVNYVKESNSFKVDKASNSNDIKSHVVVYGSIWESDVDSIKTIIGLYPNSLHLIFPHELKTDNLRRLQELIPSSKMVENSKLAKEGVNIINKMGELKYAYKIATMAYIGGGFGSGLHNVLEASVYHIPTIFGPNYKKSKEAIYFISNKCAYSFKQTEEIENICAQIDKEKNRKEIESNLKAYFSPKLSPTAIICGEIFSKKDIYV